MFGFIFSTKLAMSWYTKTTKAKWCILKQQNPCALKIQLNNPPFSLHIFLNQRLSFYSNLKKMWCGVNHHRKICIACKIFYSVLHLLKPMGVIQHPFLTGSGSVVFGSQHLEGWEAGIKQVQGLLQLQKECKTSQDNATRVWFRIKN